MYNFKRSASFNCRFFRTLVSLEHHRYTYAKWQSKRAHKARVWVNTILGVASSTNYYFTRRSYTSSARILFYRDIIVELECHGVTPPRSFRFAERMSPTFRYFAIEEDLVNLRDGGFFVPFLPRGKKKETIALSVDGKVHDLYWFISLLLIKSGKIYWRCFFFFFSLSY